MRIEQAIIKDLLLEEEKELLFPKFNVDGLLRGDYESRMRGYATGFSNGFLTVNDICRLEDMDFVSEENGGDFHVVNGSYVQLKALARRMPSRYSQRRSRKNRWRKHSLKRMVRQTRVRDRLGTEKRRMNSAMSSGESKGGNKT